jgi:heptosyltransferase-1
MDAPALRILVVRLGSMGDVLHALPAVGALTAMLPDAQIGWAIEDRWAALLCSSPGDRSRAGAGKVRPRSPEQPLVDRIHRINTQVWRTRPLARETWQEVRIAFHELRSLHYDVAIDFQGAWKSAAVALASRASVRLGFCAPREPAAGVCYTHRLAGEGTHIIEQNLSLLDGIRKLTGGSAAATCKVASFPPSQLPLDTAGALWAGEELARQKLRPGAFAIVNPGAGWAAKRWPVEYYSEVAAGLAESGIRSLVNFGPGEESLADVVVAGGRGGAVRGQYSLGELIALTRQAGLFIGGDTGPMHLAAALRVPVVAIFGPTDPARNGPYATEAVVLRSPQSVTNHSRRALPDAAMFEIAPARVLSAAHQLLAKTATRFQFR